MNEINELLRVSYDSNQPTVSARELHEFLEVGTHFKDWFPRMCEYGFSERIDYTPLIFEHPQNHQPTADYQLTIDMAKEICMLQRNEKGRQARQYFIQLEKDWNSPERIMARALRFADEKIRQLSVVNSTLSAENEYQKQMIGELQPKATYYDIILNSSGLVNITQIAKDYGMSGKAMNCTLHRCGVQYEQGGQWLLYSKYHACGYTHSRTVPITHRDGSKGITMQTQWTQKGRLFLYHLLKQNGVLPVIEQEEKAG